MLSKMLNEQTTGITMQIKAVTIFISEMHQNTTGTGWGPWRGMVRAKQSVGKRNKNGLRRVAERG